LLIEHYSFRWGCGWPPLKKKPLPFRTIILIVT
jgi:hypothetical protein